MAVNPRELKPAQLLKLINSTPAGTTLTERRLYSHRMAAGAKITATKNENALDLLRYAAWLASQRPRAAQPAQGIPPDRKSDGATAYDAHKERARARQAEIAQKGTDIGPLPAVADPRRRESCREHLRRFIETYFARACPLSWSRDHLLYIEDLETIIKCGGQLAVAMPRGSGKTTLAAIAELFAVVYGWRRYPVLIGPTRPDAVKLLMFIRRALETNDELNADFPEVCYPIRKLNGNMKLTSKQHIGGERTMIEMRDQTIVLPTVRLADGTLAQTSGIMIEVRSLTGALRGLLNLLPDGTVLRPDLVLCDDFQTKASARSPLQCATREAILHGDVMGLAGPTKKIACLVTCTVIRKGDAADRILDQNIRPQWQGRRVPMVRVFPANEKLWQEYADLRREGLRSGDRGKSATAFYRKNRKAMDAGAEVYWPPRFNDDELSAIQGAMNWRIDDEESFWAECQNQPREQEAENEGAVTIDIIEAKCIERGGVKRGIVPLASQQLVASIDVQQKLLFWMVAGFGEAFTGHIVDYGAWPDQGTHYFSLHDAKRTIARQNPGAGLEAQIYAGLTELTGELLSRKWMTESGVELSISRLLIDANWGKSTDAVYQFCRESPHSAIIMPTHGRGITGSQKPLNEYEKKPGDRVGHYWRVPATSKRVARYVLIDANYWKSLIAERWRTPVGDRGALTLYAGSRAKHRMLAEHVTAESPVTVFGRGRKVDEWKEIPGRDNHLLDCLVLAHVAASMQGIELSQLVNEQSQPARPRKPRLTLSELQGRRL